MYFDGSFATEAALTRQHFVQNGAKAEQIRGMIGVFSAHLLG
jgi:hypothetical protein